MLTLPDFKEKQILFVRGKSIKKDKLKFVNENICIEKEKKIINQASCYKILVVFIIGNCSLTSVLIKKCKEYGVSIFLMSNSFKVYASIISFAEGNYLLRMKQYKLTNEIEIAKKLIFNKIENQKILLLERKKEVGNSLSKYQNIILTIDNANDLLGIEGSASKKFFQNYFSEIGWKRRLPRTKIDSINYLLDLGYTVLFNFIDSLLGIYGFDTYKGFYHKLFFQRKSLVCDLVEPFRCIIDRQIIKSYNLGQIKEKDFRLYRGRVKISYDKQNKYLEVFTKAIMDNKIEIFSYIRSFYYFIMNESEFPVFKIK